MVFVRVCFVRTGSVSASFRVEGVAMMQVWASLPTRFFSKDCREHEAVIVP